MAKLSKIAKSLILGTIILSACCQKAEAFFWPPLPGEPVFDAGNNVSKIGGQALKYTHMLKSVLSSGNAEDLLGLKGGILDGPWKSSPKKMDEPGKLKTPGKGAVAGSSFLGIDEESVDEKQFFNAYHTLFFTHDFDAQGIEGASEALLETAYKNKAEEYRQDVAIDTYVTAKLAEDYLTTVDEMLNRLEKCQRQHEYSPDKCKFFGLTMEKSSETAKDSAASDSDENNKAQLAATRNAYIVSVVYDRLLRAIEDLAAMEAIFQSAQQMGIAKPISANEKQSSADEYINTNYRFAYADSQKYISAKGTPIIKFKNRISECDGKSASERCPQINTQKTEVQNIDSMDDLKYLQPIEDKINKAVIVHNLKSTLPQLKSQYRQYLLQKEIRERAQRLVEASENCVVNFLKNYTEEGGATDVEQAWYGGQNFAPMDPNRFDYGKRKGISAELIKDYDSKSTDITIGSNGDCKGFYEANSCPAGYEWNKNECCETDKTLCACEVAMITQEISDSQEENTKITKLDILRDASTGDPADTDNFIEGNKAEKIGQGNRESTEFTWYLGRKALFDIMKRLNLKFKPWNDQKMLQAEYLRNKYRNIGLIILSTDQAVASFKIAKKKAESYVNAEAEQILRNAVNCESTQQAISKANAKYCPGYSKCTVKENDGIITIKRERREIRYKKDGTSYTVTIPVPDKQEPQYVSLGSSCTYTKGGLLTGCVTPGCIVNQYFSTRWQDSDVFYGQAKGAGRIVAVDKLAAVITERTDQEQIVTKLVEEHKDKIKNARTAVKLAIENLTTVNQEIDKATINKNTATTELNKSTQRLNEIKTEIAALKKRKDKIKENEIYSKEDKCTLNIRIGELVNEYDCIDPNDSKKPQYNCADEGCNKLKMCAKKADCSKYLTIWNETNGGMLEKAVKEDGDKLKGLTPNEIETEKAKDKLYISVADAEDKQKYYSEVLTGKRALLGELKNNIEKLKSALQEATEKFAEEYLDAEEEAQEAIEGKNQEYEDFMVTPSGESQPYQMRNEQKKVCCKKGFLGVCREKCPQKIEKNNLEATFMTFKNMFADGKTLQDVMKNEVKKVFGQDLNGLVSALPEEIVYKTPWLNGRLGAAAVKEAVILMAAQELTSKMNYADAIVANAVERAKTKVDSFAKDHKINGEIKEEPDVAYLEKPSGDHKQLLNDLRSISESVEESPNIFGIPEDAEFSGMLEKEDASSTSVESAGQITDNAFFAGLPARGNNYRNKEGSDKNAGRDYIAPRDMLSSLPPLREVFYFSSAEYDDVPQENGKPVITELLLGKYCDENNKCEYEYLPEIWLHILARPNLRADKKYQQTFIERSFGRNKLNELVTNTLPNNGIKDARDEDYRAIIGRAGVYPCRKSGTIVDMGGGDTVKNMNFKTRAGKPTDLKIAGELPECQEVELSGKLVKHLLADHGIKDVKDSEPYGKTNEEMHSKHSELGQLLAKDLKYRPLQENIQKYLMNQDKEITQNDINRQKAERASFKRNVLGSFLDAVKTEHNAYQNMKQSETVIQDSMEKLCEQLKKIHGEEFDVELCKTQELAVTYKDMAYYEYDKNDRFGKIRCSESSYYEQIFCELDRLKNGFVNDAKAKLGKIKAENNAYINERLDKINKYIGPKGILIVDSNEIATIRPDATVEGYKTTVVDNAKANREVLLDTVEEGLLSMENQSQTVAYCPVY